MKSPRHPGSPHGMLTTQKGFTLIEVIIALVLCGIASVMVTTYIKTAMSRTNTPITIVRDTLALYAAMEKIRLYWNLNPNMDLGTLKDELGEVDVVHTNNFGSYRLDFNYFVSCDPATTTTFGPPVDYDRLLVTISDTTQGKIRMTNLFWE